MSFVDRFDKIRTKMTKDGAEWLLMATDPFHDYKLQLAGYPDMDGALSVVQMFTDTTTVRKPSATTGEWDCCVGNYPVLCLIDTTTGYWNNLCLAASTGWYQDTVQSATGGTWVVRPVQITTNDTGLELNPVDETSTLGNIEFDGCQTCQGSLRTVKARIIAQGIEIHNVTPDLYKSGSVIVGMVPQDVSKNYRKVYDNTGPTSGYRPTADFLALPSNSADAIRVVNSCQWEASRGAYLPVSLSTMNNEPENLSSSDIVLRADALQTAAGCGSMIAYPKTTGAESEHFGSDQMNQLAHTNSHFAFFSGLSAESVLTVTTRTFVEFFPGMNSAITPMCSPSPGFDIKALTLYSYMLKELPVGVPVDENPAGEYFRKVAHIALKVIQYASPALALLGPEGAAAGAAVATAAKAVDSMIPTDSKNNFNKKKKQEKKK
jgi:hypothetical protein